MSTAEIGPWSEAAATGPIPVPRSSWQPHPAAGAPVRGLGRPPGPRAGTGPVAVTDAALAVAAARDPAAFAAIYDRYSDRLHDFCLGLLRDRDAAADCVQDTFTTAATRLTQLREPDKLRPWLYAIARHEALRRIKTLRRETPSDELPDHASPEHGPEELAARNELAELVTQAAGGLSDRDRAVLDLHYRHGLDGPELADALGVSATNANTLVSPTEHHPRAQPRRAAARPRRPRRPRGSLPRAGRPARRLGRPIQRPVAQTHRAALRSLPDLPRQAAGPDPSPRPARRRPRPDPRPRVATQPRPGPHHPPSRPHGHRRGRDCGIRQGRRARGGPAPPAAR